MSALSRARVAGVRRLSQAARRVDPHLVLFDSWNGRHADSPRAIADELRRRNAPFRQVWVRSAGEPSVDGADNVRPGSREYLQAIGSAGYVFTNNSMPGYFHKKPTTTYV